MLYPKKACLQVQYVPVQLARRDTREKPQSMYLSPCLSQAKAMVARKVRNIHGCYLDF